MLRSRAVGGSDPISIGTALLYMEFAKGTLPGYNYPLGKGRIASAVALQDAIWWLEDEIKLKHRGSNIILSQLGVLTLAQKDNNGLYGMAVLNLGPAPNYPKQDQLVLSPGNNVPDDGAALLLLGISLGGLLLFKRQLMSAAQ